MSFSRIAPVLVLLLSLLGCGGSVEPDGNDKGVAEEEHHSRFIGSWLVEERVARGGYAAAVFRFDASGALARMGTIAESGDPELLGRAVKAGTSLYCEFDTRWRSSGDALLVVTAKCSDGVARDIEIEMRSDPAKNTIESEVDARMVRVGGETTWEEPRPWGWRMFKCTSAEACSARLRR